MKILSGSLGLVFAAALVAAPLSAAADTSATATITQTSASGGTFNYTIDLQNTGSTPIGTFWYSWLPTSPVNQDFLTSTPTITSIPTNWIATTTNNGPTDGTGIEWYYYPFFGGTPIPVGGSSTFSFSSHDNLASVTGPSSFYPAINAGTSFIYAGLPESDPGTQIIVTASTSAPEPASLAILSLAAAGLLLRNPRRRPIQRG